MKNKIHPLHGIVNLLNNSIMNPIAKKLFMLLCIYLFPILSYSQITLDITESGPGVTIRSQINQLRRGGSYTVELKNINTYVYNVIIDSKDTIFEKAIQAPSFEEFNLGAISSLAGIINPPNILLPSSAIKSTSPFRISEPLEIIRESIKASFSISEDVEFTKDSLLEEFKPTIGRKLELRIQKEKKILVTFQAHRDAGFDTMEVFKNLVEDYNYVTSSSSFPSFNSARNLMKSINKTTMQLDESMNLYLLDMQSLAKKTEIKTPGHTLILAAYKKLKEDYASLKNELQKTVEFLFVRRMEFEKINSLEEIGTSLTSARDSIEDFQNIVLNWDRNAKLLKAPATAAYNYHDTLKIIEDKIISIKKKLNATIDKTNSLQRNYISETAKFISFGTQVEDILKAHKSVLITFDSTYNIIHKLYESVHSDKVSRYKNIIVDIANNSTRKYIHTGQLQSDQTELTIKIVPRDSTLRLQTYNTVLLFPIQKSFYWGTGLGLYFTNFKEDRYSLRETITGPDMENLDTTFFAIQEDSIVHEIGIHANINFGWYLKKNPDWGIGISIGPGITFADKIKPRILYGANISYGSRNRLYLGIGGISGYVDKTSNAVSEDLIFTSKPESLVVSKLSTRFSISIGYFYTF